MRDSQRTVSVILEAAEQVIVQSGVEKATIDEVARVAGVSKGGVLHHFPSKEAILVGLVSSMVSKFEAEVLERQAHDPDPNGSFTRAFLHKVTETDAHCIEVFFALQAAFRSCPSLQQLKRDYSLRWQARIEQDGIDPVCASVVRLATDGLWLARSYKLAIPSEQYQSALMEHLISLTRTPMQKKKGPARRTQEFATR